MQPYLLPPSDTDRDVSECIAQLREKEFDIRKRSYETEGGYHRRILVSTYAFDLRYEEPAWSSLQDWVEICPRGPSNRLPQDKSKLPPHDCYYLEIKHVCPEDWLVPTELGLSSAQELPRRAGYRPSPGDVLLSRFKEPLGKCVIYLGEPSPFYVSTNYFLLRPKAGASPLVVLALLKSAFLACQLHHLIRRRTLIAEMFQRQVPQIMLPNLPSPLQKQIETQAKERLEAEKKYRAASTADEEYWSRTDEALAATQVMNRADVIVDSIVLQFLETAG